ncbi:MAG TPA: nuclear transport factor 2 family protein [Solirubrobacteraceae bacterium]|jgi:steroid delta-isomerase-like uncharacterized protein
MSTTSTDSAEAVVTRYFAALSARDLDAMAACWAPDGFEHIAGQADVTGPDGVRGYFGELFGAIPDFTLRVRQLVERDGRVAVLWSATGTFTGPGTYNGIAPTGSRLELEGVDMLEVRDGLIVRNDAFVDGMGFARQLGMLPPMGSKAEQRMTQAFNAKTRLAHKLHVAAPERIADGVWIVRGGFPVKSMNVYFIEEDGGGVCMFDAGISDMTHGLASAGAALGGITRVVLGHGHQDHRGAAPGLGAPVYCHTLERPVAEGDGGYSTFDLSKLRIPARQLYPALLSRWDGGPVDIAGTFEEGEEIAGFRVVHVPGHSPGMVALVRERDGLALTTDAFYTLNPETTLKGPPRLPHPAFTPEYATAGASLRKLAGLGLSAAWPGHADPVTEDVRAQLERAAADAA